MKPEFTRDGISVQTFNEIFDELVAGYRAIYGNDITVDPDSPDGQRLAIEAQLQLDLQSFALTTYQQLDPDFASGQSQQRIMKLAGIYIRPATRSQADVTIVTDREISTLLAGFTVTDTIGQSFITLADTSLSAGSNTITLFSQLFGAIEASPDTITEIATFITGIESVTNPLAATVGIDEETEEAVRIRRNLSLELPTSSGIGRLYRALAEVNNVTDLAIYENDTATTDSRNIPAHSLFVVIEGGSIADITKTMVFNKTGGRPMVGATTGIFVETVVRPDGSTFEYQHEMTFDRPDIVNLHVKLNVRRRVSANTIDIALIKEKIAQKTYNIGVNAIAGEFYNLIFTAGDSFIPFDVEISDDDNTFTDERIEAGLKAKFVVLVANIDVTEIT
jgi:uncharacterized phage protein gp47/JayE